MRSIVLAAVLTVAVVAPAAADWQIQPFLGGTFGGGTTLIDLEHAAGKAKFNFGVRAGLLGPLLGLEGDFSQSQGFFEAHEPGVTPLVLQSGVTTLTGNVIVAMPRRVSGYSLRPYAVGGAGIVHATVDHAFGPLPVDTTMPTMDVGGGATGYVTTHVGVNWDVRYFHTLHGENRGQSIGAEELSFWRATMAVALRY